MNHIQNTIAERLTHSEPDCFYLRATFLPSLCNSITCLPIVLESCSNPQKMQEVLEFALKKKLENFEFQFFCSVICCHKSDDQSTATSTVQQNNGTD